MNENVISGLKALLAFIESNPDFDFEAGERKELVMFHFRSWYLDDKTKAERKVVIADLTRRLRTIDKKFGDEFAWLTHHFSPNVTFEITSDRQTVCERVVVGKRVVPAEPERLLPAEPEREVEIVEWRCGSLLAEPEQGTVAA